MAVRSETCGIGTEERGCSPVGRASDRHAADEGSIPRSCGKGFFFLFELAFSADSLTVSAQPSRVHSLVSIKIYLKKGARGE